MIIKNTLLAALLVSSVLVTLPATSIAGENCNRDHDGEQMSRSKGAHKGGHQGHKNASHRIDRMADKLDLTDEQKSEIQLIMDGNREAKESMREQMTENRQSLRALDTASADYDANVKAIAATLASLEEEKLISRSNARRDIEAVLTTEQKAEMAKMSDNKGKRH